MSSADPVVAEIEEAFVAQWSLLGQWPGARLVDEDGVLRFETPLSKLPYNGVIRTDIAGDASAVVERTLARHRERGVDLYWVVHPSSRPPELRDLLAGAGLERVEVATGMSLEVDGWAPSGREPKASVSFAEVVDEDGLRAYSDIVLGYWELSEADRELVLQMNRHWSGARAKGRRWLALVDGRPVGKGYLSLAGPPGVGAIFGMSVRPEARGLGIAGSMTELLIREAQTAGFRRVVLHSSEMAVGVYRRAGFVSRCSLEFFATAEIWSGKH